ncbi:MAG: SDR family NAD(P)-dependent oxidoreductase, partial [Blastocatellia bacterium]
MRVDGKAAIVTGGGTGVGRATSLKLAALGCAVLVNYSRSRDEAEQTVAEMQARRSATQRGLELAAQELAQTRPLLASGAVSPMDLLRLERETTRLKGEVEQ